jgi:HPt (histidine-containing phosphotransfer) domain-containing protein
MWGSPLQVTEMRFPLQIAAELLGQFGGYLQTTVATLREAEATGNWKDKKDNVLLVAHSVKGAAAQCYARRLAAASSRLEQQAKLGGPSSAACEALAVWHRVAAETLDILDTTPHTSLFEGPVLSRQEN